MPAGPDSPLADAARLLAGARRGVAFTGAGVSAESGITTFRGEGGLWTKYDPVQTASLAGFLADPAVYWRVSRDRWQTYRRAEPNPAHLALAALEASGHLTAIVTQNTDGLHRRAGSRHIVELHGEGGRVRCLSCGSEEPRAEVQARLSSELPPLCRRCGGRHLKPTVVFFGEGLPAAALSAAIELAGTCDLLLIVGSSLTVNPAAMLPDLALRRGVPVLIVNPEPTPLDSRADAVLSGPAGLILPELMRLVTASGDSSPVL
ncbi:MAG: SIR2 family NAD-dependent protein deacylase [Candidatus Dormibacter sp.]|uniref:SIR2 family NAD-dependent protein deacylase n=1 Tax=Candidatus Dormibacter sp. TaxID=2973982 RepID=UPI000DB1253B|nr:MAG: NAD-dependent protein deacylase [Candidatus Dormibacteraeota bacterium]